MNRFTSQCLTGVLVTTLVGGLGCGRSAAPSSAEMESLPLVTISDADYRVSGPYAHENLAVYLLHSDKQDDREFITLDEGLKKGVVQVSEKAEAQVPELLITNDSDQPLFLQEGDRLKGGKQDRTLYSSLVVAPHTAKMSIPTFCIEPGRWQEGASNDLFYYTGNFALSPKEVRLAAKIDKDQGKVWANVAKERRRASTLAGLGNSYATSSLNEALDDPKIKKLSDDFANALSGVLKDHPDALGAAIVINGTIEEVNIYPNHGLLAKLYPRLIQSYALDAASRKDKVADAKSVTADDVVAFIREGREKSKRGEQINANNYLHVRDFDGKVLCETEYAGARVHVQYLSSQPDPQPVVEPANDIPSPPPQRQQR